MTQMNGIVILVKKSNNRVIPLNIDFVIDYCKSNIMDNIGESIDDDNQLSSWLIGLNQKLNLTGKAMVFTSSNNSNDIH